MTQSTDRRQIAKTSMRTVPVVLVKPWEEVQPTLLGSLVGAGIGPFPQSGLNEALGLAISPWCVGPCTTMSQTQAAAESPEGARQVSRAIVGQHLPEPDAQPGVVPHRTQERVASAAGGFVGMDAMATRL